MKSKILNTLFHYKVNFIDSSQTLIVVALIVFVAYQQININNQQQFSKEIDSNLTNLTERTDELEELISLIQEQNMNIQEVMQSDREIIENLERQFDRVNDNVDELEKITRTDPELLRKYSKVYFLNEHYTPSDLETIPRKYTYNPDREYEIEEKVYPFLMDLLEEAEDDDIDLQIISAYRSFDEQEQLKGAYTVSYGVGANQFSADQGYSEHQLGTTVDFTNSEVGATFSGFAQTETYEWLQDNAHRFGFTLSYPENNQYYQFEPWHWRFVGKDLADDLHDDNKNFYDLSQREINEYIAGLFD
ncbi:M15 family metallopeptidase [Candidatus Parcubacteria bacterium]|nr:M15 family metallopeptidase [Candidatus Parcubacteria bacterium]